MYLKIWTFIWAKFIKKLTTIELNKFECKKNFFKSHFLSQKLFFHCLQKKSSYKSRFFFHFLSHERSELLAHDFSESILIFSNFFHDFEQKKFYFKKWTKRCTFRICFWKKKSISHSIIFWVIEHMFIASNVFQKWYFHNRKKILKEFKRIEKNQRIHLITRKILPVYLLDNFFTNLSLRLIYFQILVTLRNTHILIDSNFCLEMHVLKGVSLHSQTKVSFREYFVNFLMRQKSKKKINI